MDKADEEELRGFRSRLRINKHRLDDELEVQAECQERIASRVTALEARALELKEELAKVEARLTEDFHSEERGTKDAREAKVRRHPERVKAWERHQEALQAASQWAGLLDAWKAKGKDLQALARLFGDSYFSLTQVSGPSTREFRRSMERPPVERKDYSARPSRTPLE